MQSELKPCPFCGCEKILDGYIRDGREIVCGECRASVAALHPDASKRAAERWNRRAEAVLSAAEPEGEIAGYRRRLPQYSFAHYEFEQPDYENPNKAGWEPLYVAPPEPSVAVKALHQAASDFMHLFIHDGQLTVQGLEDTDLIPAYEKLSAALSEQVQDVAGWQSMGTAPKDGTVIQAWHTVHNCPISILWNNEGHDFNGEALHWFERSYTTAWPEHAFSHWMPLPAAPAKQEG